VAGSLLFLERAWQSSLVALAEVVDMVVEGLALADIRPMEEVVVRSNAMEST
jgi:hypothetical protein